MFFVMSSWRSRTLPWSFRHVGRWWRPSGISSCSLGIPRLCCHGVNVPFPRCTESCYHWLPLHWGVYLPHFLMEMQKRNWLGDFENHCLTYNVDFLSQNAFRLLQDYPLVASDKIALLGTSFGASVTLSLAVFSETVKVSLYASPFISCSFPG